MSVTESASAPRKPADRAPGIAQKRIQLATGAGKPVIAVRSAVALRSVRRRIAVRRSQTVGGQRVGQGIGVAPLGGQRLLSLEDFQNFDHCGHIDSRLRHIMRGGLVGRAFLPPRMGQKQAPGGAAAADCQPDGGLRIAGGGDHPRQQQAKPRSGARVAGVRHAAGDVAIDDMCSLMGDDGLKHLWPFQFADQARIDEDMFSVDHKGIQPLVVENQNFHAFRRQPRRIENRQGEFIQGMFDLCIADQALRKGRGKTGQQQQRRCKRNRRGSSHRYESGH